MSPKVHLRRRMALALAFVVVLQCVSGCTKPTEDTRQNRRLVDCALTAFTTGNRKELEKCKVLIDERHASGLLSETNHVRLTEIFDQARSGKPGEAEAALYEFRKSEPFPK